MNLSIYEIGLILLLIIQFIIMIKYYLSCSKRFSKLCFGFASGIATLYPTLLVISYFGGQISINIFTLSVVSILGIPGTLLIAVASVI